MAKSVTALNAVCPYYTMYPIDFPLKQLTRGANRGNSWVLDPFCGRGTTNFAARLAGLNTVGIDSNPVAVATTKAKLVKTTVNEVIAEYCDVIGSCRNPTVPKGRFWDLAFDPSTLQDLCRLREGLLGSRDSAARATLKAIILGSLHGPTNLGSPSYLSNQCSRTFAPKPDYAIRYWTARKLRPARISVLEVVAKRAGWYLNFAPPATDGRAYLRDSRNLDLGKLLPDIRFDWIITSPPYYGMRTYLQDQWLRLWFLGGPHTVKYTSSEKQFIHDSKESYVRQLADVWKMTRSRATDDARLVFRIGSIGSRKADPLALAKESLRKTGWRITTIRSADSADNGRRQAKQFGKRQKMYAASEFDVYAVPK